MTTARDTQLLRDTAHTFAGVIEVRTRHTRRCSNSYVAANAVLAHRAWLTRRIAHLSVVKRTAATRRAHVLANALYRPKRAYPATSDKFRQYTDAAHASHASRQQTRKSSTKNITKRSNDKHDDVHMRQRTQAAPSTVQSNTHTAGRTESTRSRSGVALEVHHDLVAVIAHSRRTHCPRRVRVRVLEGTCPARRASGPAGVGC